MDYLPPQPAPARSSHSFVDRTIGAIKLSRPIFDEVRRDPSAMMQAAAIVGVTGLLSGISQGAALRGSEIPLEDDDVYRVSDSVLLPLVGGITVAVVALIFWILTALIFRFVAVKMLGSSETAIQWQEVARPLGFASAPSLLIVLTPIPVIGFLVGSVVGIWSFASQLVAMSETFRFSKWRAFFTILVSAILFAIVLTLLLCIVVLAASRVV